jgi:hypothetical protein
MPEHPEITLGQHSIPCYPQKHAYITNRVGRFGDALVDGLDASDLGGVIDALGAKAYELLCALIPNLGKRIPEYEFRGYASKEAMDAGEYDEAQDNSPTFPEIINAFETAVRVNRFDVLGALKGLVDPKVIKVKLNEAILDWNGSESLPSDSDGSEASKSSGTTPPTSDDESGPSTAPAVSNGSGHLLTTSA